MNTFISEIQFRTEGANFPTLAFCSMPFDVPGVGRFVCRSIRIMDAKGGLRVAFPSSPVSTGCKSCKKGICISYRFCPECGVEQDTTVTQKARRDDFHPVDMATRDAITKIILDAYEHYVHTKPSARKLSGHNRPTQGVS